MELIVSDDASEDETFVILQREAAKYHGPHRVNLYRRTDNSGSKSAHLNDVFQRVSGEIIVSFDGDDISNKSRVRRVIDVFSRDPTIQAVYSAYSLINKAGRPLGPGTVPHTSSEINTKAWFAKVDAYASGGTLAVRRAVIKSFDLMDPKIHEDVVLPFRASLLGEVMYLSEELVKVRRHPKGLTQSFDVFDSLETYRARILWGVQQARKHHESRLIDLRTAISLMPERTRELESLREIIMASMADAEVSAGLADPSLRTRVRALFRILLKRSYSETMAYNVCLAFAPNFYLRYKRYTLNIRR
jgi:glycosyltransferase involved in cell wall biosynthesis